MRLADDHSLLPTILVVDDKAANRDLLAYLLGSSGHVVEQAASGQAALAAVAAAVPDLVIMDISMPGVDGFTAARRLRTDARLDDVPLVAVSATSYADVSSARAAGFDALLLANGSEANHTPDESVSAEALVLMLDVCTAIVAEAGRG